MVRENSTHVAMALNQDSVWNLRCIERNANPVHEYTHLDSQAAFIID